MIKVNRKTRRELDLSQLPSSKQREHALRSFNRLLIRERDFFESKLGDEELLKIFRYIVGSGDPFFRRIGQKSWSARTMEAMAALKGFHRFVTEIHCLAIKLDSKNTARYCKKFLGWIQNYECPNSKTNNQNDGSCSCPEGEKLLAKLKNSGRRLDHHGRIDTDILGNCQNTKRQKTSDVQKASTTREREHQIPPIKTSIVVESSWLDERTEQSDSQFPITRVPSGFAAPSLNGTDSSKQEESVPSLTVGFNNHVRSFNRGIFEFECLAETTTKSQATPLFAHQW